MIKLIIFDWDDVFTLGSTEGYFKCYHKTLVQLGLQLDPEEEQRRIRVKWGSHAREELRGLLKEDTSQLDRACEIYEKVLFGNTFVDSLKLVGGAVKFLNELRKSYTLAIATGLNPRLLKEKIMPKFKIPSVFSQIISVYDVDDPNKAKPHPFMLQEIMKTQHISHNETIFVGDAKTDVQMAQGAGVTPVVVLTGHLDRKTAEALGMKHIIEDVTRLKEVLARLNTT